MEQQQKVEVQGAGAHRRPGCVWPLEMRESCRHSSFSRCLVGNRRGFTLMELLLVVAILATLSALAIPSYFEYIHRIRITRAIVEIRIFAGQIAFYQDQNNGFPDTLEGLGIPVPKDPWGYPYQYMLLAGKPFAGAGKVSPRKDKSLHPLNSDFDLYSMGADGETNLALTAQVSKDDVIRANNGDFIGLAERY